MDQLATRLKKIQEYATRTEGGYFISNFHTSNAFNGPKTFRLHFRRDGFVKPSAFDVSIRFAGDYVVDLKTNDDTKRLSFPDVESVIAYLTAQ